MKWSSVILATHQSYILLDQYWTPWGPVGLRVYGRRPGLQMHLSIQLHLEMEQGFTKRPLLCNASSAVLIFKVFTNKRTLLQIPTLNVFKNWKARNLESFFFLVPSMAALLTLTHQHQAVLIPSLVLLREFVWRWRIWSVLFIAVLLKHRKVLCI